MSSKNTKTIQIAPYASIITETLRDIGYSLETALADIIDNSIAAGAMNIDIMVPPDPSDRKIAILDDGCGMSFDELMNALRWGSKNPAHVRSENDLGRFGMGLKTAAFSQCRRLTVMTRQNGVTSAARWDLDFIAQNNDWLVELIDDESGVPYWNELGSHGTLVVLENLDRLVDQEGGPLQDTEFHSRIQETRDHLELVFHRFLSGEAPHKKIVIGLNNNALIPFNPFYSAEHYNSGGSQPKEEIKVKGHSIEIRAFTLPHEKMVPSEIWDKYGMSEGYQKTQGFYVYRKRRLIIHGTWFGLARQRAASRLSRVRIDIPSTLDTEWKLDVKKSSAQLPSGVKARLRNLIDRITGSSTRVYTARGRKLVDEERHPTWLRTSNKNQFEYRPNKDYPAFSNFAERLPDELKGDFDRILGVIGSTLPTDTLFSDLGGDETGKISNDLSDSDLEFAVEEFYANIRAIGESHQATISIMEIKSEFSNQWDRVKEILEKIQTP